jgi:molecular chaperone DnaJ
VSNSGNQRDYYEVLGVSRDALKEDIKRAYRKLALQYHPDRNKDPDAAERFREVSEAYAVLSDDEKRQQYDQFGFAGVRGRWTTEDIFGGVDFEDLFRSFGLGGGFGGFGSIFDLFMGRGPSRAYARREPVGVDLRYDMEISLKEAATGVEREVTFARDERCPHCNGTGAEPDSQVVTCSRCRGTGELRQVQRSAFGQVIRITTCPECGGRGQMAEEVCKECRGRRIVRRERQIRVRIPPGVETGQMLRLPGQGASEEGARPGDLYVVIQVRPDSVFQRVDDDVLIETTISMTQAALGAEIEVPTLASRAKLKVPPGTQPGTVLRLKGAGMPRARGGGHGDQLVRVKVHIPTKLTEKQRQQLTELASGLDSKSSFG